MPIATFKNEARTMVVCRTARATTAMRHGRFRSNGERNLPSLIRPTVIWGGTSEWHTSFRKWWTRTKLPRRFKQPWHAVSVVGWLGACASTEELQYKRFLSDDAPPLPLPACSSPWRCKCIYHHYSDRRGMRRRETDRGTVSNPRSGTERREGLRARGRRAGDRAY